MAITCFISAPPGDLTNMLREQLANEGVSTLWLDGTDTFQEPSIQVAALIERSDFVAVILEKPSPSVYFELGLVVGKGKPLLLFNDRLKLPSALAPATTIDASAIRSDGWKDLRRAFLRTVQPDVAEVKRQAPKKMFSSKRWRRITSDFEKLNASNSVSVGLEFERLVEKAFQAADLTISRTPNPDFGADFVLGSPKLIHSLGLPILVEVKTNSRTPIDQPTVDRLDVLISEGRAGAALLVTSQPLNPATRIRLERPIVVVPFGELLNWLENDSFEEEFLFTVDAFWARS